MEVLIPISFLVVLGIISPRRRRRWLIYPAIAVVSLIGFILSPLFIALANWGLVFFLPPDSGESVDAIVVLGRGEQLRERRVEVADELWRAKRSPYIFASGMLDAREIIDRLKQKGLSKDVLGGESCSQSTEENAHFSSVLLRARNVRKILLITDPPHMLRSLLLFRSFGFTVIPHAVSIPPSWETSEQMRFILREYAALAQYQFTGRFQTRMNDELEKPPAEIIQKIENWKCQT